MTIISEKPGVSEESQSIDPRQEGADAKDAPARDCPEPVWVLMWEFPKTGGPSIVP